MKGKFHQYSGDSADRRLVDVYLTIVAILFSYLLYWLSKNTCLTIPWWFDAPAIFGFYGLIFYREMNTSVIKSPEAIDSLNIPQVGILPKIEKLKKGYHILQMFVEDGASSFSEAIRSSRTIIESKFVKNKSYVVTSSNPSEGKTTYAFNLSLSLEKTNKVLFIEADIRRPSV